MTDKNNKSILASSSYRRGLVRAFSLGAGALLLLASAALIAAGPAVGPNVNMVSGTKWPEGDPFLTKQNEPSIGVSSRNARHLMAGSNDYRLVPVEIAEELDDPEAWIQVYKSVDGGATWRSTPVGGCPINIAECNDSTGLTAPLKAYKPNFGADPTVRAGPYGTFFLSFIAGTRDTSANGVVAVQRFVDKNNDIQRATDTRACTSGSTGCTPVYSPSTCTGPGSGCTKVGDVRYKPAEDPILPDVLNIIDVGTPGQSTDKPWVVADVGRRTWNSGKTCELLSWTKNQPSAVTPAAETVGAFNVYVSYANFTGHSNKPDIYVAVSSNCGNTFGKPNKISSGSQANQGTSSAIDPLTGAVYIVWRGFSPDAILMSKSTDGGGSWSKPITVASGINPYDQGATGVSFRTLDFPSVAVSVDKNGQSRVHVAWSQRKVAPSATPPTYACPSSNAADCDAHIVVATSTDGGNTFPVAKTVLADPNVATASNPANPTGRGHQVQASLTFAAGKLLATWIDQRQDHTEGVLQCPSGQTCNSVSDFVEVRRAAKNSNLDTACHIDVTKAPLSSLPAAQKTLLDHCSNPAAVWTTYITDGTPGLVRRHTVDAYTAMADPADAPAFVSSRVSQYTFGNTAKPTPGTYEIVQKEVSAPNLPMFSNGKSAFIGDYIDSSGQQIVATGDPALPYKFNAGVGTNGFVTGGFAPAFHVAFTDNRDVIPPSSGDWTTPGCLTSAFTKDSSGNITGVNVGATCGTGLAGNRNQNVYTAAVTEHSVAFAGANSKLLDPNTPRTFVITVRNLSDTARWYALTLPTQPAGGKAAFKATELSGTTITPAFVFVQPKSAAARTVFAKSSNANAKVTVQVASLTGAPVFPLPVGTPPTYTPDNTFTTQVLLNPDANAPLVGNGDGGGPSTDTAIDSLGNVVLSNAVLTNNVLSNNALTNNALSNNALTNAVLSNVVLSNAVLSNLDPANAALSNNPLSNNALTNNALSNVVLSNVALSNAALSNVVLSNAVLSNVVLSNNTLNAALTNLDPANVALSNAVLSNNALTNVALSNNALSNVMLTNNALTNAVLSNVVLSNNALSNNALSNNVLSNVALSNAPLGDAANGGDPDAISTIETGSVEIAKNSFQPGDLANSNFKETTFTIHNRGNTDTILAIKLMLRDAVCSGAPNYTCTTPPGYKLQLVLRKVALVPVAIPPTGPAVSTGRAIRIGISQSNTEVSNTSDLPLIDPTDPNFGKFLPDDPKAAMLSLAAGEYAYATIRAIGVGGTTPPDPSDLLQWGVKTVASNATNANGPLVIRTLSFPAGFVASPPAPVSTPLAMFGGLPPITGNTVCSDKFGNTVLNGTGIPANTVGVDGNYYIDTAAQVLYGPKTLGAWASSQSLINGPDSTHPTPYASVPCPPTGIAIGPFTSVTAADNSISTTAPVTFTPKYWGDFYTLASVADTSSPAQTDRQVIKVTILPRPPVLTYTGFPSTLTYNTGINLRPLVSSDSKNGASVVQPIVFSASGSCHVAPDGDNLVIDRATVPTTGPADCIVAVHQDGNEIFAPKDDTKAIFIDRASQTITFTALPVDNQLTFLDPPTTLVASVSSTTAPASGPAVTFSSLTPLVCTTSGTNGATVTIIAAGTCMITADQAGDPNYKPAPELTPSFIIKKADQNIALVAPASAPYNTSFTVSATSTSPTAPPSGIPITFASTTASVCTISGSTVSIVMVGTCTITADEAGNGNYNPAPQVSRNITITKADQNIVFGAAPGGVTFGDAPVTVSATSTSPTAPPSGTAIVFSSQSASCTTGGANGATVTIVAAGTCTIAADQAGSTNYNAAPQVLQSFAVAKAPTQITPAMSQFFTPLGTPTTLSGKINRGGGFTSIFPPGPLTIVVQKGASPPMATFSSVATAGPDGVFSQTDAPSPIPSDSYTVTFKYSGDPNFLAAADATASLRVEGFSSASNMLTARTHHATALLQDGRVLVTGGMDVAANPTNTVEIYCPDTLSPPPPSTQCPNGLGNFADPAGIDMGQARFRHTATTLQNGKVIVVGGVVGASNLDELWDPASQTWSTVTIASERMDHTATLLPDGRVFIAGGADHTGTTLTSTVIYDPVTGIASPGANLLTPRDHHTATLLPDGTVLIAGGRQPNAAPPPPYIVLPSAEIYDPVANTITAVGSAMGDARFAQSDVLLDDGRTLVAGGSNDANEPTVTSVASADFFGLGAFTALPAAPAGALVQGRREFSMTKLTDSWILAIGGIDSSGNRLLSSELFEPGPGFDLFVTGVSMTNARSGHTATRLQDGRVLVTGGTGAGGAAINSAELYNGPP